MAANITVEEIRKQYPWPVASSDNDGGYDRYCVGGAVCQVLEKGGWRSQRFPLVWKLADALMEHNPVLSAKMAYDLACAIVSNNDDGRFETAWDAVKKALEYGNQ